MVSDRLGHRHPRKFGGGADEDSTSDTLSKHHADEKVAIDTWVELRRGAGELHIQILMYKPRMLLDWCSQLSAPENKDRLKTTPFVTHPLLSFRPGSTPPTSSPHTLGSGPILPPNHLLECYTTHLIGKTANRYVSEVVNGNQGGQSSMSVGLSANKGNSRGGRYLFDTYRQREYTICRPVSWRELEQSYCVNVSTPPGQIPLHEVMREYSCSV